jgi:hypothetical protein
VPVPLRAWGFESPLPHRSIGCDMHSRSTVAEAMALRQQGLGARRIARRMGLPVATVRDWLAGRLPMHSRPLDPGAAGIPVCDACGHDAHEFAELPAAYVYLLGLYLGDGCISPVHRGVYRLRIALDMRYPGDHRFGCGGADRDTRPEGARSTSVGQLGGGFGVLEVLAVSLSPAQPGQEAPAIDRADGVAARVGQPLARPASPWADPLRRLSLSTSPARTTSPSSTSSSEQSDEAGRPAL